MFSPALASTAAPLPHPALDTAGFRPCLLLCPLLFFCLLPFCLPPAVASSFLPRAESHVDLYRPRRAGPGLGPAGADASRSPHGALARPARGERDRGDVINPAASRSARPAQEPSCGERFAFRCLRGYLRLRSYAALSPARGRRPAMWVRSHVARGGSVCGASYLSYSQPADYACARLPYLFAYDFGISLLISRYTYQHVIKSFRISQSMRGYPVKISQYVLKTFRTVRTLNPTPSAPKQWKSEVHVKS